VFQSVLFALMSSNSVFCPQSAHIFLVWIQHDGSDSIMMV